jgi:hypothetical protein
MPKTITQKAIENTVNNTVVALSDTVQAAVAGRLNEAINSARSAGGQITKVKAAIAELEKGEMKYD